MLAIYPKKLSMTQKLMKLKKKVTDHKYNKYVTTPKFNKLTAENFSARLAQANLLTKTDFDDKLLNLNRKINSNKTKHLIVENKLKKLETFNSIYFLGKSHFEDDGTQNCLVLKPMQRYFKTISGNDSNILSWKPKGLSDESIKPPTTSNKMFYPSVDLVCTKAKLKFNGDCLKKEKITFNHTKIVNIYIVYEIKKCYYKQLSNTRILFISWGQINQTY